MTARRYTRHVEEVVGVEDALKAGALATRIEQFDCVFACQSHARRLCRFAEASANTVTQLIQAPVASASVSVSSGLAIGGTNSADVEGSQGPAPLPPAYVEVLIRLAMAIAPLSHSARDYVRAFDLTSIALWRDGRLGVSRNPTGADQASWRPAKAAGAVVRAADANGRDVARYRVALTPHAFVARRATAAVGRVDASLNAAQLRGDLAFRQPALQGPARRPWARLYELRQALRRLRKAVAGAAANRGVITRSLMLSVFGE